MLIHTNSQINMMVYQAIFTLPAIGKNKFIASIVKISLTIAAPLTLN